jgi:hypothetical protein
MTKDRCNHCNVPLTNANCRDSSKKFICRPCDNQRRRATRVALRLETIEAYGGKCACCDCNIPEFLTVDHIDGKGAAHRRSINKPGDRSSGEKLYSWLKKNGFPKDNFQLLCYNCNCAKRTSGTCPHQKKPTKKRKK